MKSHRRPHTRDKNVPRAASTMCPLYFRASGTHQTTYLCILSNPDLHRHGVWSTVEAPGPKVQQANALSAETMTKPTCETDGRKSVRGGSARLPYRAGVPVRSQSTNSYSIKPSPSKEGCPGIRFATCTRHGGIQQQRPTLANPRAKQEQGALNI